MPVKEATIKRVRYQPGASVGCGRFLRHQIRLAARAGRSYQQKTTAEIVAVAVVCRTSSEASHARPATREGVQACWGAAVTIGSRRKVISEEALLRLTRGSRNTQSRELRFRALLGQEPKVEVALV